MFAQRPSMYVASKIYLDVIFPTKHVFFVSRIFPKIGKVTPHGVRKSYHRDGTIPSTIDIGSLRVGAESQVVIIIALTIS